MTKQGATGAPGPIQAIPMPPARSPSTPIQLRHLDVGQGHRIALATAGDPGHPAVLIVHGGPGSGSRLRRPWLFDPASHYLVWVDQRGCGRSRPRGGVRRNTTPLLLRDFERVREHLGLQDWWVYGGSWGAALALAYAAAHPRRVRALLLRAPYLTSRRDTERFFQAGRSRAPKSWRALLHAAGATRGGKLLHCCATVSRDGTVAARRALGLAWSRYERAMLLHRAGAAKRPGPRAARELADTYRVQAHYLARQCWLGRDGLRRAAMALREAALPVLAVQGRRDRVCPASNLRLLRGWLPAMEARMIDSGHLETEPAMLRALRQGLARLLREGPDAG